MKFIVPKNSPMLTCQANSKLQHHTSKHDMFFDSKDEIASDHRDIASLTFTFLDGKVLTASKLMKSRFRMFATGNDKFPYIFVTPESLHEHEELIT